MPYKICFSDTRTRCTAYYCVSDPEAQTPTCRWTDLGRACYWANGLFWDFSV